MKTVRTSRGWCRSRYGKVAGFVYPDLETCAAFSDEDKRPIVEVLIVPLTARNIEAIRRRACELAGNSPGSHLDTIERTLAAVGLVAVPGPEI